MKIYEFDPTNKFYIGCYDYIQPRTGQLILETATTIAPNLVQGKLAKWDGKKWLIVNDVWGKGLCWDGKTFTQYRHGDNFPVETRLATNDEQLKLSKLSIWSFRIIDGNPVFESPECSEEDKEKSKSKLNTFCQTFILNYLGITALDEFLNPDLKAKADEIANSEQIDKQWNKYIKQIESANTLADLDINFIFILE